MVSCKYLLQDDFSVDHRQVSPGDTIDAIREGNLTPRGARPLTVKWYSQWSKTANKMGRYVNVSENVVYLIVPNGFV